MRRRFSRGRAGRRPMRKGRSFKRRKMHRGRKSVGGIRIGYRL